jgi:hypothetical protein
VIALLILLNARMTAADFPPWFAILEFGVELCSVISFSRRAIASAPAIANSGFRIWPLIVENWQSIEVCIDPLTRQVGCDPAGAAEFLADRKATPNDADTWSRTVSLAFFGSLSGLRYQFNRIRLVPRPAAPGPGKIVVEFREFS